MSASLATLQPALRPWASDLINEAARAGLSPRVTSTRRSHAEQQRLYRRYLAGQQPYPVARPGTSAHEYGWAFDLIVTPMDELSAVGRLWETWGGVWGGHPRRRGSGYDPVHFEWPDWRAIVNPVADADVDGSSLSEVGTNLNATTRLPHVVENVLGIASPLPFGGVLLENQLLAIPRAARLLFDANYSYTDYLRDQFGL